MTAEDGILVGSFRKNSKEEVRVRLVTFHDRPCVDLRVYAIDGTEPVPTKKGIALSVDKIGDLKALIEQAERQAAGDDR